MQTRVAGPGRMAEDGLQLKRKGAQRNLCREWTRRVRDSLTSQRNVQLDHESYAKMALDAHKRQRK